MDYTLQPTFAEAQPAELAGWDHERNQAEGLYPHNVTLGSQKVVHWVCSRCPRGQPHRWTAKAFSRIYNGAGCPLCVGEQACPCNSLESLLPSVAAEFDVDKNGFAASDIRAWSTKKVWWRSAKQGSWRQAVLGRTGKYSRSRSTKQQVSLKVPVAVTNKCLQFTYQLLVKGVFTNASLHPLCIWCQCQ